MKILALILFICSFKTLKVQPQSISGLAQFLQELEADLQNFEYQLFGAVKGPDTDPNNLTDLQKIGEAIGKLEARKNVVLNEIGVYISDLRKKGQHRDADKLSMDFTTLIRKVDKARVDLEDLRMMKMMTPKPKPTSTDMPTMPTPGMDIMPTPGMDMMPTPGMDMMGMPGKPDMDMDQMPDSVMPTMTPGMDMDADSVPSGIPDLPSEPQTPKEPEIDMGKMPERGDTDADKRPEVPDRDEMIPFPPPPPPPFPPKPEEEEREELQPIVTMKTMKVEKPTISPTKILPEPQRPQIDVQPVSFFQKLLAEKLRIKLNFLDAIKAKVRTMARAKNNFLKMFRM